MVLLCVLPMLLMAIGIGTWVAGALNMDEYQREGKMMNLGLAMLGTGAVWLFVMFVIGWWPTIKRQVWEWCHPAQDTSLHWGSRHRRRRRRSSHRHRHHHHDAPASNATTGDDVSVEGA